MPYRVEIHPAMWIPTYPNSIYRRHYVGQGERVFIPISLATVIPQISAWSATYPDFARRRAPVSFFAPSFFKPDATLPNVAFEVSSWLATYPDFARGRAPTYHLGPTLEWDTITPAPVPVKKRRGNLLTIKAGY